MLNENCDSPVTSGNLADTMDRLDWVTDSSVGPILSKERRFGSGASMSGSEILSALQTAVLCTDRAEARERMYALLEAGVSRHDLIEHWIPTIARHMGDAWCEDGRSFAEVTIGSARLQSWLRELDEDLGSASPFQDLEGPTVLLVVPEGSHHTLGAMVAMSLFRKAGALVRLSLGRDTRAVAGTVRNGSYDLVAISAAGSEDLDFLSALVNSIRTGLAPAPAVVLGGEILNVNPDAAALIGADHATSDPEEALSLCGLTISESGVQTCTQTSKHARGQPSRVPIGT